MILATAITEYIRSETESLADIECGLEGTVFHVTKRENWPAILATNALVPNQDGRLASSFGSQNSFFRRLGCVSLFDYRMPPNDSVFDFRRRCYPFQPAEPENEGIAILVLNPAVYPKLIPWTLWKDQKAYGQMVVPYVEVGHLGPISLDLVERMIFLRHTEDPTSMGAVLRRALSKHSR